MPELQASERLMELVFDAVHEGLKPLQAGRPLIPFTLRVTKEGVVKQWYREGTMAEALGRAQHTLSSMRQGTTHYVLAYDGVIEVDGEDVDAIMLEAGEKPYAQAWRFVQRYHPRREEAPFERRGDLALFGNTENPLVVG